MQRYYFFSNLAIPMRKYLCSTMPVLISSLFHLPSYFFHLII